MNTNTATPPPVLIDPVPRSVFLSAVVLSCLALVLATLTGDFPLAVVAGFAFFAVVRLTLGAHGDALIAPRLLRPLALASFAAGAACLFHLLGKGPALNSLLIACVAVQAYLLVPRQTPFVVFLQVLFATTTAVGAAFLVKTPVALGFAVLFSFVLAWTLLLYERGAALSDPVSERGATRLLRTQARQRLPLRAMAGTALRFLVLGFPLGLLLYVGVPRTWSWLEFDSSSDVDVSEDAGRERSAMQRGADRVRAFSGPVLKESTGSVTVAFGAVAEVKRNLTPFFEVREVASAEPPKQVILRESVLDLLSDDDVWDSSAREQRPRGYRCEDSGVVDMGRKDNIARGRTLEITVLQGRHRRLYLEPVGVEFRIRRQERTLQQFHATRRGDAMWAVSFAFRKNDVVVQRSVPQEYPDAHLMQQRSDSSVSPRLSYLQVPERLRARLARLAQGIVGSETNPWRRARMVEAWLRSERFEYALRPPPLDPNNRIMDFLLRVRSGHCEMYATVFTMLMRSLGHPMRYARGFWGGDATHARGSVIMRGTHYHAWTEMYLSGDGWIPLNPTPPDRRAVDADTNTVESAPRAKPEEASGWSFLGLNSESWHRFWGSIGDFLRRFILDPLGRIFGQAPWVFFGLFFGLIGWAAWRRRGHATRVVKSRTLDLGTYGEALLLLAAQGTRRRRTQTLREFESTVVAKHPEVAAPFGILTTLRERERYCAIQVDGERAGDALKQLRHALPRGVSA